jgi:hypothetical protein
MNDEAEELFSLAYALCARVGNADRGLFRNLIADMKSRFDLAKDAPGLERLAEEFGCSLRRIWLEASECSASRNFRSPPAEQKTRTATGRSLEFGYERDLQPAYLEDCCTRFFDVPPEGWTSDHVLLSSGQSAMAAALHALEDGLLVGGDRKLSFVHLGAYFETAEIFSLFSSLLRPVGSGRNAVKTMDDLDADVYIIEPVFCDGEFGCVDVARLVEHHEEKARRRVYIFDTTLTGTSYSIEKDLAKMRRLNPGAVFRVVSGLKLLQGGLELSSVGILTVFTPDDAAITARQIGNRIRKIRTLLGLGLSFAEVAALEAPWFLDRDYTTIYQKAVFANNALLATAVSSNNRFFRGVFHPSLLPDCRDAHNAPYCVFRFQDADPRNFAFVEEFIRNEARERGILFQSGGSFGFRGHRFEVVHPGDGSEPFLRVALGRRPGWSCNQIANLISDLASR